MAHWGAVRPYGGDWGEYVGTPASCFSDLLQRNTSRFQQQISFSKGGSEFKAEWVDDTMQRYEFFCGEQRKQIRLEI